MASQEARHEMIRAAERLVAERGLAAMSLREVQAVSGQRNKSAAQYHFGSREGLIEAVVLTRMGHVNERRAELLAMIGATTATDPAPTNTMLEPLVDALVRPLVELSISQHDSHWARFVLQCAADPLVSKLVQASVEGSAYRDLRDRFAESLPQVPAPRRQRRVDHAVGIAFMAIAAAEANIVEHDELEPTARAAQWNDVLIDLGDVCLGVLVAPSSFP